MRRILFICALLLGACATTQSVTPPASPTPQAPSGIADKVAGMQKFEGFFNFYYDVKTDKVWLEIDKFDMEFLHVNSLSAGIGSNDIGLDRLQLGGSRIVYFQRQGPKVLLVQPNYSYRAISDNLDEVAAVKDAFAKSILWGFKVDKEENGRLLVDATDFFIRDAHNITGRLQSQGSYRLDKGRSAFYLNRTRNFPKNSEFEVTLTYTGSPRGRLIGSVTPNASAVTVRQHHSFVELPDDNYTPRKFDPRAGYGAMSFFDYATPISEPINKRFIARHRLEKKDPTAAVSEAVEPIVYYLDRGTPEPIRSALLDGARWWDQAFEAAGYKDAFQVKMLPEDADPMDLRYNMINWVHRSTRGWSYGSSVRDPRTGEIIKGHVTLGSLRVRQDFLIAEGLLAPYEDGTTVPKEMEEMALARLRQLSAHEVGHTIGLSHSYTSSTEGRASVMDYPHPQIELVDGEISLANAYDDKIGEWDKVSIAFGYQDFPEGTDEAEALEKIIQDGLAKGLTFLSDQDARPQGSAHPYAHLWDNGGNVAEELEEVMKIREVAINNFGENNIRKDVPMSYLNEVLAPMYFFHRYQVEAAVKVVGGLDYRNARRGDGQFATKMVDPARQAEALNAVLSTISPEALTLPENVISIVPPRSHNTRLGRENFKIRTGITFDPIGAAETASDFTLGLLFNPAKAARLVELNSRDAKQPSLSSVIDATLTATFKASRKSGLMGEVQRTVEQMTLQNLLALAASPAASTQTKAITNLKIGELHTWMKARMNNRDLNLKAHYTYLVGQIDKFNTNPDSYIKESPLSPPDGSPIGMDGQEYCDW